jgi:hypothetical protein
MSWLIVGTTALAVGGQIIEGNAARDAAGQQSAAAQVGIDEQRTQFDAIQKLLSPYVEGGQQAFGAQQELLGLQGQESQQAAIDQIQQSPQFQALEASGQNAILQNASATGGLRGGNVQGALAQFSPALLNQSINQQFQNLGGLAQAGQASAAGVGQAGLQTGGNVSNLLGQQGAIQAGGTLGQAQAGSNLLSGLGQAGGLFLGQQGGQQAANQGQASLQQQFGLPPQNPFLKSTF